MHLLICFELNDPEIEKHNKWTPKRAKLGMVSSCHPHGMCKKVEMVTAKTGCTSCTNTTLSFEVSGFQTKTHLLHRLFKILITYYNSGLFAFIMHHSKPHRQLSTLSDIIWYFWCIYWLVWAKWPWNWKALQMNSEKVETWHGIIISPTWHVRKCRDGYGKNWMHFMYKLDTLFRCIRVLDENSSVTKGFHLLELIWTPNFLCVKNAPFKATSSIFNPF